MKAMVIKWISRFDEEPQPLKLMELPIPEPEEAEVQIKVSVCGVCHTELDEIEGRTPPSFFPIVPGHQVVGIISKKGNGADKFEIGDRVGVAWIFSACGKCEYCKAGKENLCDQFLATGRDANGGYAEYMTAPEKYIYKIPEFFSDVEAAPLLCAGAIGYRSIMLSDLKDGENLGLTGFGASAHLVLKMVRYRFPNSKIYVFSRNEKEQQFALSLGAIWAGDISERPPEKLHKIIDTTPAWKPVVEGLSNLKKGGRLIINAIRKEKKDKNALLELSYPEQLWLEKEIKSVTNVTSIDVIEFLELAAQAQIKPDYKEYPLEKANEALKEMKEGNIRGAKVLRISEKKLRL